MQVMYLSRFTENFIIYRDLYILVKTSGLDMLSFFSLILGLRLILDINKILL